MRELYTGQVLENMPLNSVVLTLVTEQDTDTIQFYIIQASVKMVVVVIYIIRVIMQEDLLGGEFSVGETSTTGTPGSGTRSTSST